MYDFIHKHKRAVQIGLAMMMLPFLFFGVDFYSRGGDTSQAVATVRGQAITRGEFDQALRDHGDRLRQSMGRSYDAALLDSPEVRFAVVETLVNQRLLAAEAVRERFRVSDLQLAQFIADIPVFQEDGKFSPERYRSALQSQNMTPALFEDRFRRDLATAPLQEPLSAGSIVARSAAARYLSLLEQRREVASAVIDAEAFLREAKVTEAAVKAFYDQNPNAFATPEQARVEYAILSADTLAAKFPVDAAEVRKHYDEHLAEYSTPEERSAAHILVTVKPDAGNDEKEAAKKKADQIAAQVRSAPARFAEIAKAQSQDPGSAGQGGDLGSFPRGTMVKAFEDAVFAAKTGDIVGPILSDFGWHVIRVSGAKSGTQRPFDEVRPKIEADLKRTRAQQKFSAAADQFQNLVYEQADSLEAAGKALDIPVETTPFITRTQAQQLALNNPKFAAALFAPESLAAKRNTEAIEVGPSTLIAGRIVEYRPAAPRPFDDVKNEIGRQLERRAAAAAAESAGRAKLALLEQGKSDREAGVTFGKPVELGRSQSGAGVSTEALARVFQADRSKLPTYVTGTNARGSFTIHRVTRVIEPDSLDDARLKLAGDRMGEQLGREFVNAYLVSLRARSDVKINQAQLEKK